MTPRQIAWIISYHERQTSLEDELTYRESTVEHFPHLVPGLRACDERKYDLILISPCIAPGFPGHDYLPGTYDNDPRIEEIMKEYEGQNKNPDYWKLALYAIDVVHRTGKPNQQTPVIVTGFYHPTKDRVFPNARQTCLRAGAKEYYYLGDPLNNNAAFMRMIKRNLKR